MSTLALSLKLSAVKTLSAVQRAINILRSAGPGAWYDPSDLTQAKATWRRNLMRYTEQFDNAAWTKSGVTVTPDAAAGVDGSMTADKIVATAAAGVHSIYQTCNVAAGAHTFTVRAKAGEYNWLAISMDGTGFAFFNLTSGTTGGLGAGHTSSISAAGGGYYDCKATYTFTAGSRAIFYNVASADNVTSFTGDGVGGIFVAGAQLEAGSTATAYQRITDYNTEFLQAFPDHALYQDSAGTTPVTAVEQPVGRILDKSGGGNHLIQPTATSRPILSARKNLLLGTEVLSTQNVTTKAASHVLSFYGTGTVTLSGTSTAGPLVGTGVSDRVSLTFTPTAGTLTLTVSGSVTRAQLEYAI